MSDTAEMSSGSIQAARTSILGATLELTKPRIAGLVLVAAGVGFYLGLPAGSGTNAVPLLLYTLAGTALVAVGANAFNQLLEVDHDAKMTRTANRPLPTGRLSRAQVSGFAWVTGIAGLAILALQVNLLSAAIALATIVIYVCVYTPLKRVTSFCIIIGAIPGALPPVIGWAGAAGSISMPAWFLFGIVFLWQLPHVAAIAWLHQEDYRRAGFAMLSVVDPSGLLTNIHTISHTVGLVLLSILPAVYGMAGPIYAIGAMSLGIVFLAFGLVFTLWSTPTTARYQLLASVAYLPGLLTLMIVDKSTMD